VEKLFSSPRSQRGSAQLHTALQPHFFVQSHLAQSLTESSMCSPKPRQTQPWASHPGSRPNSLLALHSRTTHAPTTRPARARAQRGHPRPNAARHCSHRSQSCRALLPQAAHQSSRGTKQTFWFTTSEPATRKPVLQFAAAKPSQNAGISQSLHLFCSTLRVKLRF